MRTGIRQFLSMASAFAIAMHTVLWVAVAPLAAIQAIDPFTVICHSETSAPAEQAPGHGPAAPGHACDHCNLRSAVAPPMAPVTALTTRFEPVRTLGILRPVNVLRRDDVAADPKLARGPPAFV
jgi:hypothetical protein